MIVFDVVVGVVMFDVVFGILAIYVHKNGSPIAE